MGRLLFPYASDTDFFFFSVWDGFSQVYNCFDIAHMGLHAIRKKPTIFNVDL